MIMILMKLTLKQQLNHSNLKNQVRVSHRENQEMLESIEEAKAHNARTDLGYVAFVREFADWLNSRDLQEAYDAALDVLQDKGMSEKQAIGFLNSPHGKYMGEYLVPGRDFGHEAFLDKLDEYYNERMLKKFAKDYAKLG